MRARTVVAVVGLEDGPELCAGPGVLATLAGQGLARVAVTCRRGESGVFRADVAEFFEHAGDPRADEAGFVERLEEIVARRKVRVLLAGAPHVARVLARHTRALAKAGAKLLSTEAEPLERLGAIGLDTLCRSARWPALATWKLPEHPIGATFAHVQAWPIALFADDGSRRRVADALDALRAEGALRARGARHIRVAAPAFRRLVEVCLVVGRNGALLGSCALRVLEDDERLRPWLAVTLEDPELVSAAHALATSLQLVGPLAFLLQPGDEGYAVLDVHACFPVWIEAVRREGPNLAALAVAAALDARTRPVGAVPAGTLFSQTAHDIVIDPRSPAAAHAE